MVFLWQVLEVGEIIPLFFFQIIFFFFTFFSPRFGVSKAEHLFFCKACNRSDGNKVVLMKGVSW